MKERAVTDVGHALTRSHRDPPALVGSGVAIIATVNIPSRYRKTDGREAPRNRTTVASRSSFLSLKSRSSHPSSRENSLCTVGLHTGLGMVDFPSQWKLKALSVSTQEEWISPSRRPSIPNY